MLRNAKIERIGRWKIIECRKLEKKLWAQIKLRDLEEHRIITVNGIVKQINIRKTIGFTISNHK